MAGDMEAKLDKLISEVCNISELVASFHSFQNMFTTLDNRINHVKASHQDLINTVQSSLHTRINTVEALFENRLRNVELFQETSVGNVHHSVTEERNSLKNDVAELSTLMDKHSKDNWEFEEAVSLFSTVTRYGMKNMAAKLSNSLKNALTVINCIQVFQLASQYEVDDLWEASKEWISENFVLVSHTALDFWKLTVDEMCVFVYSDTLSAKQEDVFKAISKWVKHDRIHRTDSYSVLLNAVQFRQCTANFLQNILDHYLVFDNPDVLYAVEEAIKQKMKEQDNIICTPSTKCTKGKDVLFVLGGDNSDGIIETYNADQCTWTVQTKITEGPSKTTFAVTARHQIFVLEQDNERFRSFDTLTKEWNALRPLPKFRGGMSAAMEENKLFVMGGDDETRCDVYDIHLDSWAQVTSLIVGRMWSASSSLHGKIYCCGGRCNNCNWLSSMEVFDPKEKSKVWKFTASMSRRRGGHCLVSCSQYLWAVGGSDESNALRDLERFNPSTNSWTTLAAMSTGRYDLTTTFFGGQLYAIGGNNDEILNMVEVYDPVENRWTTGAPLNRRRFYHASCVVKEMSNANEYQCTRPEV